MKKLFLTLLFSLNFAFANPLEFNTLSSDFTQTVTSDGSSIKYSGNFITTKELAFWHYSTPNLKDIYFSKTRVVSIEPDLEQAILTKLDQIPNLTAVLQSAKKEKDGSYSAKFDDITYKIELENNLISKISYKDKLDNDIEIKLNNVKKDEPIDESKLEPIIPKGYDIITQ
ncbi:LolA-like outer membrane lipoprotein chaperone [Campylobacter geochelonis]|uniref:Outer-membrane lipoprotein carrier protein n=1 Tax=Campylobacter geochelonis TaxID=1780362 RepID=A0A128EHU7_9BACT|nr:LolA-like outer membrane lipoprotein chaperone [Campylobacter geochelonis]QKF71513.1 periplasmic outer membrane-specific lipoprotein chaperone [Campylobacter geochelonis]CZE47922.1 outer-membrane lipoprotein carrier protein [Campylobacter geochelonis]CZE48462.1 outer-membrane lipoprotein carrier protein [Campylobacter geochelonis]CZE50803.1 outer-membrane lipoprotein carrier protein [Campylobacter geochelonis]